MFYRKNKLLIILLIVATLLLSSCSNIRSLQLSSLIDEEGAKIQQMSQEIIRCFIEKDKDALEGLFCEQTRNLPEFDKEIDKAFEYFKGDWYTTANIDKVASGGESVESGRRTSWDVYPIIPYIEVISDVDGNPETSINYYYSFDYFWHIVNDEDKSLEGLQYITITLLNIDSMKIGKFIG